MRINPMLFAFVGTYRRYKTLQRFVQIFSVVLKFMLRLLFHRLFGWMIPKRLKAGNPTGGGIWDGVRRLMEELGPTFIKFGQILSTRTEIPLAMRNELKKLQEAVPPFSYKEVNDIIEQELAAPIEELFVSFEKEPIAAASLAQVHRAWLREGEEGEGPVEVAVKVQRPNLGAIIVVDSVVLEVIARLVDKLLPRARIMHAPHIIESFTIALKREMDFVLEGRNADKLARLHKNDGYVKIPKIYWDYTTSRVVTMEFIHGVRINDFKKLDELGWDRWTIANNQMKAYFDQIFKYGFLHADPHPGNLYIQDEDVICFLDFGMTEYVDDDILDKLTDLLIALVHDNSGLKTAQAFMNLHIGKPEEINFDRMVLGFNSFMDRRFVEGKVAIGERGVGFVLNELLYVAFGYGVSLPLPSTLIIKTLLYVEMLATELCPGFDIQDNLEKHSRRRLRRKLYHRLDPTDLRHPRRTGADIGDALIEAADYAKDLPKQVSSIMGKMERGELEFRTREVGGREHTNQTLFNILIVMLIIGLIIIVVMKF